MAINAVDKRRRIATAICAYSGQLMDTIRALDDLANQVDGAGLVFEDTDFIDAPGLRHTDAAHVVMALANVRTLYGDIQTRFVDDVFESVRP